MLDTNQNLLYLLVWMLIVDQRQQSLALLRNLRFREVACACRGSQPCQILKQSQQSVGGKCNSEYLYITYNFKSHALIAEFFVHTPQSQDFAYLVNT
jgi:hypothetical protein